MLHFRNVGWLWDTNSLNPFAKWKTGQSTWEPLFVSLEGEKGRWMDQGQAGREATVPNLERKAASVKEDLLPVQM